MKEMFIFLARYNAWANTRLHGDMERLTPRQLTEESAVNFGSILAIANHLVLADRLWLNRFTGQGQPVTTVDVVPYPDLESLSAARKVEEERMVALTGSLDPARLVSTLDYRTTEGNPCSLPFAACLMHCLNHQTHHRGQIHGLLGANGIKAADIDLLGFRREAG